MTNPMTSDTTNNTAVVTAADTRRAKKWCISDDVRVKDPRQSVSQSVSQEPIGSAKKRYKYNTLVTPLYRSTRLKELEGSTIINSPFDHWSVCVVFTISRSFLPNVITISRTPIIAHPDCSSIFRDAYSMMWSQTASC